jgi:hypothetical protein
MHLSLYLDDCADDDTLAALLRQAGHQVSTPRIAGTSGLLDREHLDYAAQRGYTLLTKVPDDDPVSGFDVLLFTTASPIKKPDWAIPNRALEKRVAATLTAPSPEPRVGQ